MYTYRIRVANLERVQIEQLDLNNQSLGNPSGQLRFEQRKEEINSLIENIREREFSDPNLVRLLGEALFEVIFDDVLRQSFINFYDRIVLLLSVIVYKQIIHHSKQPRSRIGTQFIVLVILHCP